MDRLFRRSLASWSVHCREIPAPRSSHGHLAWQALRTDDGPQSKYIRCVFAQIFVSSLTQLRLASAVPTPPICARNARAFALNALAGEWAAGQLFASLFDELPKNCRHFSKQWPEKHAKLPSCPLTGQPVEIKHGYPAANFASELQANG